ncbi:uncharacterized protein METZ01_LOCUS7285 [marine metagenome]|uniref:Enoyl reductase (ER) domain-containing protein n=1 Tax=marine metagenome TaxID=408172 RepID=A0A381NIU0_9ZZZZ|tara:strand:+ start:10312 stop:11286 length:975 start_codon:yes stop_codon:yes gene_type:complete
MYKAAIVESLSENFSSVKIVNLERKTLKPNEIRVLIKAASVNFPDLLMISGLYQFKPEFPFVLGMESAGIIIEVGKDVKNFTIEDEVIVGGKTGSFSEEIVVTQEDIRRKPKYLSWEEASAFTVAYLTAYVALICRGNLNSGESLLVHGAAGGVGLAAVDLGNIYGANVIATASSSEKRDFLIGYGVEHVLPVKGFKDRVKELTEGKGADVIYDPVGGDVFDESVRCIAWNGRLLIIGFTSGRIPSISVNIPLIKGFSVVGVRGGEFGRRNPKKGKENLDAIDNLAKEGKLNPNIYKTYPLENTVDALLELRNRSVIGKVCIKP